MYEIKKATLKRPISAKMDVEYVSGNQDFLNKATKRNAFSDSFRNLINKRECSHICIDVKSHNILRDNYLFKTGITCLYNIIIINLHHQHEYP